MNNPHQAYRTFDPSTGRYLVLEPRDLQWAIPGYDIPTNMPAGWRSNGSYYTPEGLWNHRSRQGDYIVTRPEGYVPYQSVVQPDGRHAYDPNEASWERYPRTRAEELESGRTALLPQARQFEFMLNRSDNYVHRPGEKVEMGINYDQMRTAPQGLMGPPPNPRNPSGGYGGSHGGQR